jgi:hypothetical protein
MGAEIFNKLLGSLEAVGVQNSDTRSDHGQPEVSSVRRGKERVRGILLFASIVTGLSSGDKGTAEAKQRGKPCLG